MKTKPTVAKLKKKLDAIYSRWLRITHADSKGYETCYTCGVRKFWGELQAGHYIRRSHNTLRYDPRNVKPQCVSCNLFKNGAPDEFALHLIKDYGATILEDLNNEKYLMKRWTIEEFQDLIDYYEGELKKYTAPTG